MPSKKSAQGPAEDPKNVTAADGSESAEKVPQEAAKGVASPSATETVITQETGSGTDKAAVPDEVELRGEGTKPQNPVESMPPLEVTPERGDEAMQRSDEAQQHPALRGKPEVEVAERSADGSEGLRFVKQFILKAVGDFDGWIQDEQAHVGHKLRTLEEALQRGLHAKGDVSFDGVEDHGDGVSKVLTYSVETVPAVVDSEPATTMTVSNNETTGDCPTKDELTAPPSDAK